MIDSRAKKSSVGSLIATNMGIELILRSESNLCNKGALKSSMKASADAAKASDLTVDLNILGVKKRRTTKLLPGYTVWKPP